MHERPNESAMTGDFEFDALQKANNYRAALIREFSPFLKGRVMEIGAGIGQFTGALAALPAVKEVVAIEPEARFCQAFRRLHPSRKIIEGTMDNLADNAEWDAAVCINVLEHIRDDDAELRKCHQKLAPRAGHLCLFVPARQEIYAPLDQDFGHHRRYARPQLRQKLSQAGFQIVRLDYFNCIGYFAWWFNFCLLKKRRFDISSVLVFDRVIFPLAHSLERHIIRPPFGQSLLAVACAASQNSSMI